jgi:YD repeat-containing protein
VYTLYTSVGRVILETNARNSGGSWYWTDENGTAYDAVHTRYNGYGDVSGRGRSAAGASATYQEEFFYDRAGRLVRTSAQDGVWRWFAYDKAGNQTASLASAGEDMSSASYDHLAALSTTASRTATFTSYDKRGQATQTVETGRQLGGTTATVTRARTYNAFGEVLTETDSRGNATGYAYSTMGRMTHKTGPAVSVTTENGAVTIVAPTDLYRYDIAGRLVGTV